MQTLIVYIITFFYIYSIKFNFSPIGSRVGLGVLGAITIFLFFLQGRKIVFSRKYTTILLVLLILIPISLVSISYNSTSDYEFLRYVLSILIINLSSYFVFWIYKRNLPIITFEVVSNILINVVLIQSIITLLMFLSPDFTSVIFSLQSISLADIEKLNKVNEFRLIGFGTFFFGAGVIHGFILIIISIRLKQESIKSNGNLFSLTIKFLIIGIVGIMMSRTAVVGAVIGLLIYLFSGIFQNISITRSWNKAKFLFFITFIFSIVIVSIKLIPSLWESIEPIFNFVFEIAINYVSHNYAESESTNHLFTMYIFPNETSSWIIGDGLWSMPDGRYYMDSDVGYVRLIFYFGLVGFFVYFLYHYLLIFFSFGTLLSWVIFIYFCTLNLKGFTDLTPLILLYTHIEITKRLHFEKLCI